jgi:hypothetical protein
VRPLLVSDPLVSCPDPRTTPVLVPPKRPPLLIALWVLRPNPVVVLVLLLKPDLRKTPAPISVARPNSPGVLVVL